MVILKLIFLNILIAEKKHAQTDLEKQLVYY